MFLPISYICHGGYSSKSCLAVSSG
jgi:hypothetical protein